MSTLHLSRPGLCGGALLAGQGLFLASGDYTSAMRGNFLVRERVKRILEAAVPGACTFFPTAEMKSKKPTPWWLAVPNEKLATVRITHKPLPPSCSKCGEPRLAWGDNSEAMQHFDSGCVDVFKSLAWSGGDLETIIESTNRNRTQRGEPPLPWSNWGIEPPPHPERWTRDGDRQLSTFLFAWSSYVGGRK